MSGDVSSPSLILSGRTDSNSEKIGEDMGVYSFLISVITYSIYTLSGFLVLQTFKVMMRRMCRCSRITSSIFILLGDFTFYFLFVLSFLSTYGFKYLGYFYYSIFEMGINFNYISCLITPVTEFRTFMDQFFQRRKLQTKMTRDRIVKWCDKHETDFSLLYSRDLDALVFARSDDDDIEKLEIITITTNEYISYKSQFSKKGGFGIWETVKNIVRKNLRVVTRYLLHVFQISRNEIFTVSYCDDFRKWLNENTRRCNYLKIIDYDENFSDVFPPTRNDNEDDNEKSFQMIKKELSKHPNCSKRYVYSRWSTGVSEKSEIPLLPKEYDNFVFRENKKVLFRKVWNFDVPSIHIFFYMSTLVFIIFIKYFHPGFELDKMGDLDPRRVMSFDSQLTIFLFFTIFTFQLFGSRVFSFLFVPLALGNTIIGIILNNRDNDSIFQRGVVTFFICLFEFTMMSGYLVKIEGYFTHLYKLFHSGKSKVLNVLKNPVKFVLYSNLIILNIVNFCSLNINIFFEKDYFWDLVLKIKDSSVKTSWGETWKNLVIINEPILIIFGLFILIQKTQSIGDKERGKGDRKWWIVMLKKTAFFLVCLSALIFVFRGFLDYVFNFAEYLDEDFVSFWNLVGIL